MGRSETGTWPGTDPAVEGDAQDGDVGLRYLVDARQAGEGALPGVAGDHGGGHRPDEVTGDDSRNKIGHFLRLPWWPVRPAGRARRWPLIQRRRRSPAVPVRWRRWRTARRPG